MTNALSKYRFFHPGLAATLIMMKSQNGNTVIMFIKHLCGHCQYIQLRLVQQAADNSSDSPVRPFGGLVLFKYHGSWPACLALKFLLFGCPLLHGIAGHLGALCSLLDTFLVCLAVVVYVYVTFVDATGTQGGRACWMLGY